jgi:hypothetical protein
MSDPFQDLLELSSRFPEKIATIFAFTEKSELKKHLKKLTITLDDLARARFAAPVGGYGHRFKNYQFVPEQIQERFGEIRRLRSGGEIGKVLGILNGVFDQRRLATAHMFETEHEWHVFYFDNRDLEEAPKSHWVHGPHVHFVNYLWSNLNREEVWASLARRANRAYGLHVRFDRGREFVEETEDDLG